MTQSSTKEIDRQENLKTVQSLSQLSGNHMDIQKGYEPELMSQAISFRGDRNALCCPIYISAENNNNPKEDS